MASVSVIEQADRIIREGEERAAQYQRAHIEAIVAAVLAGEPITVCGVRYVPDQRP